MIARRERRQILERVKVLQERRVAVVVGTLDDNTVELWFQSQTGEVLRRKVFSAFGKASAWLSKLDATIVDLIDGPYGRGNEDKLMRRLISAKVI